jgi:SAM-dependent methyltransferase
MTPEEFLYHVYEPLPRQGPGCTGATWKAWSYLLPLPVDAQILDVGCGTGVQIQDLADLSSGTITAVDNHRQFLDIIMAWTDGAGMGGRVQTVNASMDDLPFENGQFDLIWSEDAIYIMGFAEGLAAWRPLCKPGGQMVISDIAWFETGAPDELREFLKQEGCVLATEEEKREQVRQAGFRLLATYRLPEAGWWKHFYLPLLERVAELRKTYGSDPEYAAILDSCEHEAAIYQKYKRYYGNTFFVMQVI